MNSKYLTVSAINRYLKSKFDSDDNLRLVFLKGEVSNIKYHTTGHIYFSIKDEESKINAVMFASQAKKLLFKPIDGSKVLVTGRISVYPNTGSYQIYVDEMLEDGMGNLFLQFEKLKADLQKEGLFDEKYKKKIPLIPERIGIITAPTGAAIKDIISTIKRRYPKVETILFPSLVQGESAKDDIVRNIKFAENYDLDVLIVGRGGGSIEDLWAFNEECVARAIFDCKIPIISAVGHEVDFTIADFVADLRAPTPTGAAEMAVPNIVDLINHINNLNIRLNESIKTNISLNRAKLDQIKSNYILNNPNTMYDLKRQNLDYLIEKLVNALTNKSDLANHKLELIIEKLKLLNPLNILERGYTLTYKDDKLIKDIKNVKKDDLIKIKLINGEIESKIVNIKEA